MDASNTRYFFLSLSLYLYLFHPLDSLVYLSIDHAYTVGKFSSQDIAIIASGREYLQCLENLLLTKARKEFHRKINIYLKK